MSEVDLHTDESSEPVASFDTLVIGAGAGGMAAAARLNHFGYRTLLVLKLGKRFVPMKGGPVGAVVSGLISALRVGVGEWATGGQSACVETMRLVTDVIRNRYSATTVRASA